MKILLNAVILGTGVILPGQEVSVDQLAGVRSAGGTVLDSIDPRVANASALCQQLIASGHFSTDQLQGIMLAAMAACDEALDLVIAGPLTLAGVAVQVYNNTDPAWITINNIGATTIYVGKQAVTGATDGFALAAGQSRAWKARNPSLVWVIGTGSGTYAVER